MTSDWKNLTIIGNALAVQVASLCLWISMDLNASMITQQPSYCSWIVTVDGYKDSQMAQIFTGLTRMLAIFLAIIIAIQAAIAVNVYFRVNVFAEEALNDLR